MDSSSTDGAAATITSALFEVSGFSVTLDMEATEFRALMPTHPEPKVGDEVGVRIVNPLVYVEESRGE